MWLSLVWKFTQWKTRQCYFRAGGKPNLALRLCFNQKRVKAKVFWVPTFVRVPALPPLSPQSCWSLGLEGSWPDAALGLFHFNCTSWLECPTERDTSWRYGMYGPIHTWTVCPFYIDLISQNAVCQQMNMNIQTTLPTSWGLRACL